MLEERNLQLDLLALGLLALTIFLAAALLSSGNGKEAADQFQTVLRINPENATAKAALDNMSNVPSGR